MDQFIKVIQYKINWEQAIKWTTNYIDNKNKLN